MKCMVCEKGLAEGVSLYRQNPKGEIGIWACAAHRQEKVDAAVQEVVDIVEAASAQ